MLGPHFCYFLRGQSYDRRAPKFDRLQQPKLHEPTQPIPPIATATSIASLQHAARFISHHFRQALGVESPPRGWQGFHKFQVTDAMLIY